VLLDHGVYSTLSEQVRHDYTRLWRAILTQDNIMMKQASVALGVPFYELFASIVVQRKYEDIMDTQSKSMLKKRLGT